ncbi:peptide chain release factor N(5)-glutamine methyltransferase [Parvibaculum sp.]|uniref:peptide chain release factor N(5)-glutamine methyltransferase n=1 Tax=Parvibaculum sp. TaxID=2024848 RepID=UPI0027261C62|nr:peptide chain release factor N(5)-glutamine methyltransferase [Parvibaculum sp.]MDO9126733.1 peptide chain release factor N(5)-glutamine methyltransferase [Parvibaculum sp.]MDP3328587.1 peptide chain release factor N(5)-glutamine methyltransferase [Parvibaculum sp.]
MTASRDHAMRMLGWRLKQAGLPTPELDARLLVQAVTGASGIEMIREPGTPMTAEEEERLAAFERRRLAREPVSRILGIREFWGLAFAVTAATLDPRPDSETLIETSLKLLESVVQPRLLDLGTGTGCLLLTLLHERQDASGTGVDISEAALEVARENAARLGLAGRAVFRQASWAAGLSEKFDLVISNPPYIASGEIAGLDRDVREYDPLLALDGGADGLDAYRAIAAALPDTLTQEGVAVVELGQGQAAAVRDIFEAAGCPVLRIVPDLSGTPRALVAGLPRR